MRIFNRLSRSVENEEQTVKTKGRTGKHLQFNSTELSDGIVEINSTSQAPKAADNYKKKLVGLVPMILTICVFASWLACPGFAGQGYNITVAAGPTVSLQVRPVGPDCWYENDMGQPFNVAPGELCLPKYTEANNSGACLNKVKRLTFSITRTNGDPPSEPCGLQTFYFQLENNGPLDPGFTVLTTLSGNDAIGIKLPDSTKKASDYGIQVINETQPGADQFMIQILVGCNPAKK